MENRAKIQTKNNEFTFVFKPGNFETNLILDSN